MVVARRLLWPNYMVPQVRALLTNVLETLRDAP